MSSAHDRLVVRPRPDDWQIALPQGTSIDLTSTLDIGDARFSLASANLASARFTLNLGTLHVDLTGATVGTMNVSTNLGSAFVTLDGSSDLNADLKTNLGSLDVCVPAGLGVQVSASDSLSSSDFSGAGLVQVGGLWQTPELRHRLPQGHPHRRDESRERQAPLCRRLQVNPRRLYRSADDRILAGVAGGLAAYFDVDPVIVRVIWFLSVFVHRLADLLGLPGHDRRGPARAGRMAAASPWAPGGAPLGYGATYQPPSGAAPTGGPDAPASRPKPIATGAIPARPRAPVPPGSPPVPGPARPGSRP